MELLKQIRNKYKGFQWKTFSKEKEKKFPWQTNLLKLSSSCIDYWAWVYCTRWWNDNIYTILVALDCYSISIIIRITQQLWWGQMLGEQEGRKEKKRKGINVKYQSTKHINLAKMTWCGMHVNIDAKCFCAFMEYKPCLQKSIILIYTHTHRSC